MRSTNSTQRASMTGWPTAVLVVTSVAAASVALGLTVVGPMIQRRMETPPPMLSANAAVPAAVASPAGPQAEVQIKERIIPRPRPKPAPIELALPPGESPSDVAAALNAG